MCVCAILSLELITNSILILLLLLLLLLRRRNILYELPLFSKALSIFRYYFIWREFLFLHELNVLFIYEQWIKFVCKDVELDGCERKMTNDRNFNGRLFWFVAYLMRLINCRFETYYLLYCSNLKALFKERLMEENVRITKE